MIETADDTDQVGDYQARITDGLNVDESGSRAKRDEGKCTRNEPGQEDRVDGNVPGW